MDIRHMLRSRPSCGLSLQLRVQDVFKENGVQQVDIGGLHDVITSLLNVDPCDMGNCPTLTDCIPWAAGSP